MALQLWQRAVVEPGENWRDEKLDGRRFEMDENDASWTLPERGVLELDYATYQAKFEAHYRLELSKPDQRAVAFKLQERARSEPGDNFVNATHDGVPIPIDKLEAYWSFPKEGVFECDYVCKQPQHVSTRHYVLDLASADDRALAERLYDWALAEPGENWMNESIDGEPFTFNEGKAQFRFGRPPPPYVYRPSQDDEFMIGALHLGRDSTLVRAPTPP